MSPFRMVATSIDDVIGQMMDLHPSPQAQDPAPSPDHTGIEATGNPKRKIDQITYTLQIKRRREVTQISSLHCQLARNTKTGPPHKSTRSSTVPFHLQISTNSAPTYAQKSSVPQTTGVHGHRPFHQVCIHVSRSGRRIILRMMSSINTISQSASEKKNIRKGMLPSAMKDHYLYHGHGEVVRWNRERAGLPKLEAGRKACRGAATKYPRCRRELYVHRYEIAERIAGVAHDANSSYETSHIMIVVSSASTSNRKTEPGNPSAHISSTYHGK
jgi:hypothetical protein